MLVTLDKKMINKQYIFLLTVYFIRSIACQTLVVQSPAGSIKGRIIEQSGKKYSVFQGIPFAKPPVGKLRFQPPEPLDNAQTSQTIDATKGFSKQCIQMFYSPVTAANQSEDCLYLNVYSPRTESLDKATYPVMVWVYGGAFVLGSTSEYPMEGTVKNMVSRGVVFVSMNYRVGLFGFYTSKSKVAPGNYGFLDQVEALKWVQKNIQSFGGDPSKVTIFGESAGGASVSMLTVTPLTKGLYKQAIMMSGSATAPWATMGDNQVADKSGHVTESVGCNRRKTNASETTCFQIGKRNVQSDTNQEQCLKLNSVTCPQNSYIKNVSPDELKLHQQELECIQTKSIEELMKDKAARTMGWAGRVDGHFLPDTVEELMKIRNPNNFMIGVTKDEFAGFAMEEESALLGTSSKTVLTEELFHSTPQLTADAFISCQYFQQPGVVNFTARRHYSQQVIPNEGMDERHIWFQRDINMKSAILFWAPAYKDIIAARRTKSNVYVYSFDWKNAFEIHNSKNNFTFKGAGHATELMSLFADRALFNMSPDMSSTKTRDSSQDDNAENTFGLLWTNFAKFGNPTPNGAVNGVVWKPFDVNDNYLSLDFPNLSMKNNFLKEDAQFWNVYLPQLEASVVCGK